MTVPSQKSALRFRRACALAVSYTSAISSVLAAACSKVDPTAPPIEAGADTTLDAPPESDAALACSPETVTDASAGAPPTPFYQGRCVGAGVVDTIIDCTFDPAQNPNRCANFMLDAGNDGAADATPNFMETCRDCLITPATASALGPVIVDGDFVRLNVAGCLTNALPNDTGSTTAFTRFENCVALACQRCFPSGVPAYEACATAARRGTCAALLRSDEMNNVEEARAPGQAGSICNLPFHFLTGAIAYGYLFCGSPPPSDAGADSADAANAPNDAASD